MVFINISIDDLLVFEFIFMIKWYSYSVNNQIGQFFRQIFFFFYYFVYNFLKIKKKLEDYILYFKMCQNFKISIFFFRFRLKILFKINCFLFLLNVRDYFFCYFGGVLIDIVQLLIELFFRVYRYFYRVRYGTRENFEYVGFVWSISAI